MDFEIYDYGMHGEGVSNLDGKITLISNALVGETLEAEITKQLKNMCYAKTTNIKKVSKNRVNPPCPYFYNCGGCAIQHMDYAEQLKFKTLLVKKTIKKILGLDVVVSPCIKSEKQFAYRNKMSFATSADNCGLYIEDSKQVVDVDFCMLADDEINKILTKFKKFLKNMPKNEQKSVKNLVIRKIFDNILIGVVSQTEINLKDFCLGLNPKKVGVFLVLNTRKDSVVLSGKLKHVFGITEFEVNDFGLTYFVDLFGFQQTNQNIQNKLYNYVLKLLPDNAVVVNGFSGQGLLSAIVSKKSKKVYGVEINKYSHKCAEKLKKVNKIANLENICADFTKTISTLPCDCLILDPSKKGVGENLKTILKPKQIIYISCNPIALCKDLKHLLANYTIKSIQPFDMFPNTNSVETVVQLIKN